MKRKLINFEAFKNLEDNSLSKASLELDEASSIVGKALGVDVELHCFGDSTVIYEASNGAFIHADYKVDKNYITLENIQELVIDEASETVKAKETLSEMLEAVVKGNTEQADDLFNSYISMPRMKSEARKYKVSRSAPTHRSKLRGRPQNRSVVAKRIRARLKTLRRQSPSQKRMNAIIRHRIAKSLPKRARARVIGRYVNEQSLLTFADISENVLNYIDFKTFGPTLSESSVDHDENGNVINLRIPTSHARNEAKLLSFNVKTLDSKVKVLRDKAKKLNEDTEFCKAIAYLKRQNALVDNDALVEALEDITTKYPQLIYLTQDELTGKIKDALKTVGATNWDDNSCNFMSEGLLRTAFNFYPEKIEQISNLAKAPKLEGDNAYEQFQGIVEKFYSSVDETLASESQVFQDLFDALKEVHKWAREEGNREIYAETHKFMNELDQVLNGEKSPEMSLAEAAALWLQTFVETNLETGEWEVAEPHVSVNGDHPVTSAYANKSYTPDKDFSGNYDSENNDDLESHGFGNMDGTQDNPYLPKAGDFKVKGEKDVDSDDPLGSMQSDDTWPNLKNPYLPKLSTAWNPKKDNVLEK